MKDLEVSYMFPDPKYREEILKQPIREILEDLFYVSGYINDFYCQADCADYAREDEWFKLYFDMKEEIIRRTGEENE